MTVPDVLREAANAIFSEAMRQDCTDMDSKLALKLAEAAIAALQLTQEWAFEFTEPLSGTRKHHAVSEADAKKLAAEASPGRDAVALSRFVGPWSTGNTETEEPQR